MAMNEKGGANGASQAIAAQNNGGHHNVHAEQQLNRGFSLLSLLGLAFAILNTWTAAAASLSLVLPSGGPTAALYGMFVSGFLTFCMAASLGEMCSVYPTVGGQYHFSALFARADWGPMAAWIDGWFAVAGWWALVGTNGSLAGQLITGLVALWHPDYTVNPWLIYVVYVIWVIIAFCINAFAVRALPYLNTTALFWSLTGVVMTIITVLVTGRDHYQPTEFVFATTISETGWPTGISWILGLLQSAFALTAFDSVMHLAEEVPHPEWNCPIAMVAAIGIGSVSGFIYLVCLLYSVSDYDALLTSPYGSLLTAYYQATENRAGATCLQVLCIGCQLFACTGAVTTASRMTWSFARDGGLPGSRVLAKVVKGLDVPLASLVVASIIPIAFGAIYLGSSSALNAILSSSVVFLNLSYGIPIAILIVRGRHLLDVPGMPKRRFSLGPFGYVINVLAVLFVIFTTIFFLFPPAIPVNAKSMNYTVCVIFLILAVCGITWLVSGRKHYTGPRDIDALLALARHGLQKGEVLDEDLLAGMGAGHGGLEAKNGGMGKPVVREVN